MRFEGFYVNEKSTDQLESNQRPSDLYHSTLSHKASQKILNGLITSEDFWKEFKIPPIPDKGWLKDSEFPILGTPYPKILPSQFLKNFVYSQATKQHIALISQKFSNPTSFSLSDILATC